VAAIPPSPLVGREREQSVLRDQFALCRAGQGRLVLIGGAAGIGKTALAALFCREATDLGARVLTGRCFDRAESPAYGPWLYLFERLLATLPATPSSVPPPPAFHTPGTVGAVAGQAQLFRQVLDFFKSLTAEQPVILLLDDVQWSDPDSLDLLRALAQSLDTLPLLILVTYRNDELSDHPAFAALLPALVREAHAVRLDLHPLADVAVQMLVTQRYHLASAERARLVTYLQARAEGNPLFLGELLRALEEDGILRDGDARQRLGELNDRAVPPLLRQMIDHRFARLDGESQRLLTIAAVVGQEVPLDLWTTVAAVDEDAVLDAVEQGLGAHMLQESPTGDRIQFSHALIREAILAHLPAVRRRLHQRVGDALLGAPAPDPDAVAYQLQRADDPRAGEWLVQAGQRAQRAFAFQTAIARYEAALARMDGTAQADERGWLLYRLARALRFLDPRRAITYVDEVERIATQEGDAALGAAVAFSRAHFTIFVGEYAQGLRLLRPSVDALERLTPAEQARIDAHEDDWMLTNNRALLVIYLAWLGHHAEAVAMGRQFVTALASASDGSVVIAAGDAYYGLMIAHTALGQPQEASEAAAHARAANEALGNSFQVGAIALDQLHCAQVPYLTEDLAGRARLAAVVAAALEQGRGVGDDFGPELGELPLMMLEGRWTEARALATAMRDTSPRSGWREYGMIHLGPLAWAQGEPELA
jgi:hypothetical protein